MEQVIRYRTTSESAREAFLEYLTALQSRLGSVGTDAYYADSVSGLVRNEVMPAARKFTNQLQAIGEQLFGALAKGAMGAAGGAGGVQLLGDISLQTLLAVGAATAVYVGKAAIDAYIAQRAVRRECCLSYLLSLDP